MSSLSVTAIIINFQTPDLTRRAVMSFRYFYPSLPLLVIDNGSTGDSPRSLAQITADAGGPTDILFNSTNLHHGPAMDQAVRHITSDFALFLDSDCEVVAGGFVENMAASLHETDHHYAAGKMIFMNDRGFDVPRSTTAHPYIRPICLMVKRNLYLRLPPFQKHGSPCLDNMVAATDAGFTLVDVPVEEYIRHKGRGTAGRFGYRLGWKGRMNHLLNRLGL
jgi:glycosyltransferase involved in cell wall biosynthesis